MMSRSGKRRYRVSLEICGTVDRLVMATSDEDAIAQTKKLLLQGDGMTPQPKAIPAFCWDVSASRSYIHYRDMTEEEIEAESEDRNTRLACLALEALEEKRQAAAV